MADDARAIEARVRERGKRGARQPRGDASGARARPPHVRAGLPDARLLRGSALSGGHWLCEGLQLPAGRPVPGPAVEAFVEPRADQRHLAAS